MICPHCHQTIAEQDHYLMSARSDGGWPNWATPALWLLLFLAVVATLALFSHNFAS